MKQVRVSNREPDSPAAGQRRLSLLVRFDYRWPGVPERWSEK